MLDVMKLLPAVLKSGLGVLLLSMLLISCSSSTPPAAGGGGGGRGADPLQEGVALCYFCHYPDDAIDRFTGENIVEKWRDGPHGNSELIPAYEDVDWEDSCASCHDELGDGALLEAAGLAFIGLINRPIVGCESCHGDGTEHGNSLGLSSPQYARPDQDRCGKCHFSDYVQDANHDSEGDNILEDYISSPHFTNVAYDGLASTEEALCAKCHTDEGAKFFRDDDTVAELEALILEPDLEVTEIQCRTCHDSHNPGSLLEPATVSESAEYRTCTNCHQAHDADVGTAVYHLTGGDPTDGASVDGDLTYHAILYNSVITDTHFDDPLTSYGSAPNLIEGYTMNPASERSCRDCHNVHSADLTINEQWAESAHGGHILAAKEAAVTGDSDIDEVIAVKAAGAHDGDPAVPGFAAAWVHYNWDQSTGSGNRAACQRCHTATGVKNYLADPAGYDPVNNDYSHLVGWTAATGSGQNEMLYCWGCHRDNAGTLRNPGSISESYDPGVPTVNYPDVTNSNICLACHLGREIGEVVKVKTGFEDEGFVNSHYLAAGSTLFKVSGYEFGGAPDYDNLGVFAHDIININDEGPCVSCHMGENGAVDHTFEVVTKNNSNEITAINSNVCVNCHSFAAADLQAYKEGYQDALAALEQALANQGLSFGPAHPYFYTVPYDPDYIEEDQVDPFHCIGNLPVYNWNDGGTTIWTWDGTSCNDAVGILGTVGTGMDRMGAAFNYNLFAHDPGGFVHNSHYTKLLIFDSIDILDGSLDGIIDLAGYANAAAWLKPGYADINAVARP